MHSEEKYTELAEKWMNGTITPEEERVFAEWYNANRDEEVIVPSTFASDEQEHRDRILAHIRSGMNGSLPRRRSRWLPAVAAAVLLLAGAGSLWWGLGRSGDRAPQIAEATPATVIRPVTDKATLTLGDGSTVNLEAAKDGSITASGAAHIDRQAARLVYKTGQATGATEARTPAVMAYNTLTTPRGGLYSIILPDGTKAWLNASSSLRYPVVFRGATREVTLTGEGYFEVAPNAAQPFVVRVGSVTVNVLGTHFDVMAYDDEPAITTTLLVGAVNVQVGDRQQKLIPGEQAQLIKDDNRLLSATADVDQAIAWKNGIFKFKSEDIRSVMRKVSRWYDVDVTFEGTINEHFTGAVPRGADVRELLKTMELTNSIHFRVEGNRITVTP